MNDVNDFSDFWSWTRLGLLPLVFPDVLYTYSEGLADAVPAGYNLSGLPSRWQYPGYQMLGAESHWGLQTARAIYIYLLNLLQIMYFIDLHTITWVTTSPSALAEPSGWRWRERERDCYSAIDV